MTSVALIKAAAIGPFFRPISWTALEVMIDVISWPPRLSRDLGHQAALVRMSTILPTS
jgi:hypothetical protein